MPLGKLPHRGEELFTILFRHDWKERLRLCLSHRSIFVERDYIHNRSHRLLLYDLARMRRCLADECFSLRKERLELAKRNSIKHGRKVQCPVIEPDLGIAVDLKKRKQISSQRPIAFQQ